MAYNKSQTKPMSGDTSNNKIYTITLFLGQLPTWLRCHSPITRSIQLDLDWLHVCFCYTLSTLNLRIYLCSNNRRWTPSLRQMSGFFLVLLECLMGKLANAVPFGLSNHNSVVIKNKYLLMHAILFMVELMRTSSGRPWHIGNDSPFACPFVQLSVCR